MRRTWLFIQAVAVLLACSDHALAQCAQIPVLADGRVNVGLDSSTVDMHAYFTPTVGRSYSIEITVPITTSGVVPHIGFISNTANCPDSGTISGAVVTNTIEPRLSGNGTRWSVISQSSNAIRIRARDQAFNVSVSETTLYNPSWSTVGGYFTQWGLQNTTGTSITGTLTVQESYGGSATYTRAVTLPANVTTFLTTLDPGFTIPPGRGGSATFAHNGPPGSVLGDAYLISPVLIVPAVFRTMRESLH
jgi:hypothetical protein